MIVAVYALYVCLILLGLRAALLESESKTKWVQQEVME
jgi:hypothetical protein